MSRERFFRDPRLPFVEGRYAKDMRRVFKPHLHRRFSLGAIDTGAVIFLIADQAIHLRPGARAFINPETLNDMPCKQDVNPFMRLRQFKQTNGICLIIAVLGREGEQVVDPTRRGTKDLSGNDLPGNSKTWGDPRPDSCAG